MTSHDVLERLKEAAREQATALELSELYYAVEDAASILQISRARLYRFLRDKEYGIETISFGNSRKRYVLVEDVRRLYEILHTPFLQYQRPAHAPTPAAQRPRIAATTLRRIELQPLAQDS